MDNEQLTISNEQNGKCQSSNCFVYRNTVIESLVIKSLNDLMTE
jgi:hypothetical protein